MADELDGLRRMTERRQQAEREWMEEIRRLFAEGQSLAEIAKAAGIRYEVVVEIVRPR
jgi:predicted transposase YdaD